MICTTAFPYILHETNSTLFILDKTMEVLSIKPIKYISKVKLMDYINLLYSSIFFLFSFFSITDLIVGFPMYFHICIAIFFQHTSSIRSIETALWLSFLTNFFIFRLTFFKRSIKYQFFFLFGKCYQTFGLKSEAQYV